MKNIMVIIVCLAVIMSTNTAIAAPASNCIGTVFAASLNQTSGQYNRSTENFTVGDKVFITGFNFKNSKGSPLSGKVNWTITNQSANGSVKPVIASGNADLAPVFKPSGYGNYPNLTAYIIPKEIWTITAQNVGSDLRLNVWHTSWPAECQKGAGLKIDTFYGVRVIPEFSSIALPIAIVIGLLFLFMHRKKKEE